MLLRVIPLVVVVVVLFCTAKFLRQHNIIREIVRELREAVTPKVTYRSIDFWGFVAIFALIVLCYIIHELLEILKMALIGANDEDAALYDACRDAFSVIALGLILLLSIKWRASLERD
jgi:hypothetical protein